MTRLVLLSLLIPGVAIAQVNGGAPLSIPLNKSGISNPSYDSKKSYGQGEVVSDSGLTCFSKTFGNRGNASALTPSVWHCFSDSTGAGSPTIYNTWAVGGPTQGNGNEGDVMNTLDGSFYGGGRNYGPVFSGGWRGSQMLFIAGEYSTRGIHHTLGWNTFDAAVGDSMAALGYGYHFSKPAVGLQPRTKVRAWPPCNSTKNRTLLARSGTAARTRSRFCTRQPAVRERLTDRCC